MQEFIKNLCCIRKSVLKQQSDVIGYRGTEREMSRDACVIHVLLVL